MSDDLNSFFGKKKGGKKKKKTQNVNILEKKLEKAVKEAEEQQEEDDALARSRGVGDGGEGTGSSAPKRKQEDEEWHDYIEEDDVGYKIKEMNLDEMETDVILIDRENGENDDESKKKSWNVDGEKDKDGDDGEEEEEVEEKKEAEPEAPKTYRPPASRRAGWGGGGRPEIAPDIGNDSLFPSIGAAEEIAKEQEHDKKKQEHTKLEATGGKGKKFGGSGGDTWEIVGGEKKVEENKNVYRPGAFKSMGVTPPAAPRATAATAAVQDENTQPRSNNEPTAHVPRPGSYVPPSLRGTAQAHENRFNNLNTH